MSQRGGAQNAGRPSRRAVRGNPRRTFGSGGALGRRGRALTCRTLRRLDRRRPWARAAPRRSTLLSGRLPAGPWQSGETEATALFPSLPPSHPGACEDKGGCASSFTPPPPPPPHSWPEAVGVLPEPLQHAPTSPPSHSPRLRRARPAVAPGRRPSCYLLTPPKTGSSSSCRGGRGRGGAQW